VGAGSSPTVLCIGRLAAQKGIDLLLEAWRCLGDSSLKLLLVGDGPPACRRAAGGPSERAGAGPLRAVVHKLSRTLGAGGGVSARVAGCAGGKVTVVASPHRPDV
jgi:hypothetical protein